MKGLLLQCLKDSYSQITIAISPEQAHYLQDLKNQIDNFTSASHPVRDSTIKAALNPCLGSTSLETWQAAIEYAMDRDKAIDEELIQIRARAREIQAYTGQNHGVPNYVKFERPAQTVQDEDEEYLMKLVAEFVQERKRKGVELRRLRNYVLDWGNMRS